MNNIVEIAFDIQSQDDWDFLEALLGRIGIPFYVEPPRRQAYSTLEDLEIALEGK